MQVKAFERYTPLRTLKWGQKYEIRMLKSSKYIWDFQAIFFIIILIFRSGLEIWSQWDGGMIFGWTRDLQRL